METAYEAEKSMKITFDQAKFKACGLDANIAAIQQIALEYKKVEDDRKKALKYTTSTKPELIVNEAPEEQSDKEAAPVDVKVEHKKIDL